jgi:hypothetical protein
MAVNGTLNETPAKTAFSTAPNSPVRRLFSEVYLPPKLEQSFRRNSRKLALSLPSEVEGPEFWICPFFRQSLPSKRD